MADDKQMAAAHCEQINSREAPALALTTSRAKKGATAEHNMSVWDAIKAHPMAVFWSLAVSCTIIMEGYDTIL